MKVLNILGFVCLVALSAGCQKGGDIAGEVKSELEVIGMMEESQSTKVSVNINNEGYCEQRWELGDHIIGSYTRGGEVVDIDYEVAELLNGGKMAVFKKSGIFDDPVDGEQVYVLCLGQKGPNNDKTIDGKYEGSMDKNYTTIMTGEGKVVDNRLILDFTNKASVVSVDNLCFAISPLMTDAFVSFPTTFEVSATLVNGYSEFTFNNGVFATPNSAPQNVELAAAANCTKIGPYDTGLFFGAVYSGLKFLILPVDYAYDEFYPFGLSPITNSSSIVFSSTDGFTGTTGERSTIDAGKFYRIGEVLLSPGGFFPPIPGPIQPPSDVK